MRPAGHLILSGLLFLGFYYFSRSFVLSFSLALAQVAVDIDHLVDYIIFAPRPLSIKKFFTKGNPLTWRRIVFFLHGWEWVLILFLICIKINNSFLWVVSLGYFIHLCLDTTVNRFTYKMLKLDKYFYFLIFRFKNGFIIDKICPPRIRQVQ
ncbi:MAG: hypothetical protein HQL27_09750 [Candidatus Omnitrophica bacterium]|nr:hypothetical protein [Candidatus Omnitrophota bacterium]